VPALEGWQITPYYQPAREVGGDFYDFFELEDGRVGLAVGDATGKGMPAAIAVTASCSMLRVVAQDSGYSPGEVLARVNETLLARIPANMFVTCFYAILDPESATLSYANAGHNLPYCRREDAANELEARGMPLGLMPGMSYEEKVTVLGPREEVLFYTDGLVEAHNPQGEMFGTPRLRSLLSEYPMGGAELSGAERHLDGGVRALHWRGVGPGGRHYPPYGGAVPHLKLNSTVVCNVIDLHRIICGKRRLLNRLQHIATRKDGTDGRGERRARFRRGGAMDHRLGLHRRIRRRGGGRPRVGDP
jgi:hypothetical protein